MPPAASDNQGLKIAVASFVTLSVVLAVATYFGFSNSSYYQAKFDEAQKEASNAKQAQNTLQNQFNDLKEVAGYAKTEDSVVKDQVKKDIDGLSKSSAEMTGEIQKLIDAYKSSAGANASPKVDELAQNGQTIITSLASEPNKTLQSTLNRLVELMSNQTQLLTAIGIDYQATRHELEASNQVAQEKVNVEVGAKEKAENDLLAVQQKHEEERRSLISRLDELQTRNSQQATEITTLKTQLAQAQEDWQRRYNLLMADYREVRERLEKKETVLDQANGYVTYVDYTREEVFTTLNRRQGARPQLILSVFDKNAPGLPTDTPKATIELIKVDDNGSIARIIKTFKTIEPIRAGDQVYSPAFKQGAQTFALIGKIDVDRDGRDDRGDLKRLIESAGGQVVFDLPPPGIGKQSGELTPRTDWYVLDDRLPIRSGVEENTGATGEEIAAFEKQKSDALKEARLAGVRPISIERLLAYIGYRYGQPVGGQAEAINRKAIDRLLNPKGKVVTPTPPAPTEPDAAGAEPAAAGPGAGFP